MMKKILLIQSFLLCTLLLPALSNNTLTDPIIIKTNVIGSKVVKLHLANLEQGTTVIRITNLEENIVYLSEVIKNHNGYSFALNLQKLKDGKYLISVGQKKETIQQVMRVDGPQIYLSDFKKSKK